MSAPLTTYLTRPGDRATMRCLWELYGDTIDHAPFLEALVDGTLVHLKSEVNVLAATREDPLTTAYRQMRMT